jgi:hypothetical protein
MPNSRWGTLRWAALTSVALCAGSAGLLHAGDSPTAKGNLMLTGSTSGYYNGGEWPELTRTVLSVLYLAIIANDEEEDYHSHNRHNRHGHCYDHDYHCDEEFGISFPKAQLGFALSYFVSPDLAVGGRYIYRRDFKDNTLETLWGGGPELTYYFGLPHHSIRPFVGGSLLFTRAVDRFSREQLEQGTSVNVRGGFNVALSPSWGLILQSGYQNDQLPGGDGDPRVSKTLGFGFGLMATIR